MNVLDSPLEALTFDYVSFGIFTVVNNLWTWVALFTAAVSFWKIRTSGSGDAVSSTFSGNSDSLPSVNCIDLQDNESRPVRQASEIKPAAAQPSLQPPETAPVVAPSSTPASSKPSVFESNRVTKGKFIVYYSEDDRESEVNGVFNCNDGEEKLTVVGEWENGNESWERVLRRRMGEMEWYRYQDLTVINGNVVRLWDGVRRTKYRSGCGVW